MNSVTAQGVICWVEYYPMVKLGAETFNADSGWNMPPGVFSNPADDITMEKDAVWEQFYEQLAPEDDFVAKLWELEGKPEPAPALDLNSFSADDWGNFFTSEGSLTPTEKKYDIVNNELTDALDAQHNAVEAWARQEGMAIREKVQKEKQGDNYDLGVRTDYHNMELGNPDAGVPSTFAEVKGMNTDAFAIVDVSDLAQSQGLSMNEIMEADSQRKINNQAQEEWETEPIDVSEFVEDKPMVDYSEMEVPEEAQKYDPMEVKGYDLPDFDIYEVDLEGGEDV